MNYRKLIYNWEDGYKMAGSGYEHIVFRATDKNVPDKFFGGPWSKSTNVVINVQLISNWRKMHRSHKHIGHEALPTAYSHKWNTTYLMLTISQRHKRTY